MRLNAGPPCCGTQRAWAARGQAAWHMPEEPLVWLEGMSLSPTRRLWAAAGHAARGMLEGRLCGPKACPVCTALIDSGHRVLVPSRPPFREVAAAVAVCASRINVRRCYGGQQSLHGDRSTGYSWMQETAGVGVRRLHISLMCRRQWVGGRSTTEAEGFAHHPDVSCSDS